MKYTISLHSNIQTVKEIEVNTQKKAIQVAKQLSKNTKDTNFLVYITFYRKSDGQHGYLNPKGYGISGKAWN